MHCTRWTVVLSVCAAAVAAAQVRAGKIERLLDGNQQRMGQLLDDQTESRDPSRSRFVTWHGFSPLPALGIVCFAGIAAIVIRARRRNLTATGSAALLETEIRTSTDVSHAAAAVDSVLAVEPAAVAAHASLPNDQ